MIAVLPDYKTIKGAAAGAKKELRSNGSYPTRHVLFSKGRRINNLRLLTVLFCPHGT
jgi:hypothetical protein